MLPSVPPLQGFLSPHGFLEAPPPPPSSLVRRQDSGKAMAQSYPGSGSGSHMLGRVTAETAGGERAHHQHDEASHEAGRGRDLGYGGSNAGWRRGRRPVLLQPLQPLQPLTNMGHQPGVGLPPPPPPPPGQRFAGAFWGAPLYLTAQYYPPLQPPPPPPPPPRRLLQTLSAPAARTPFMSMQAARRDANPAASRLSSFHGAASSPLSPPHHLPPYGAPPPAAGLGGEDRRLIRGPLIHPPRCACLFKFT